MAEQGSQFGPGKMSLRLEENECVTLSPESPRFRESYQQVRPRTIEEVRNILGLTGDAAKALQEKGCCRPSAVSSALISADDLTAQDDPTRIRARSLAYAASREYVRAPNPTYLSQWQAVLNRFLEISNSVINVVVLLDIDVANGATLTISPNTHAIYANNVRIHGNGRIVCQRDITFKINSLEGISARPVAVPLSSAAASLIGR